MPSATRRCMCWRAPSSSSISVASTTSKSRLSTCRGRGHLRRRPPERRRLRGRPRGVIPAARPISDIGGHIDYDFDVILGQRPCRHRPDQRHRAANRKTSVNRPPVGNRAADLGRHRLRDTERAWWPRTPDRIPLVGMSDHMGDDRRRDTAEHDADQHGRDQHHRERTGEDPDRGSRPRNSTIVIVRRRPIRSEIEPTMRPPAITAKPIVVKASAARPEFRGVVLESGDGEADDEDVAEAVRRVRTGEGLPPLDLPQCTEAAEPACRRPFPLAPQGENQAMTMRAMPSSMR